MYVPDLKALLKTQSSPLETILICFDGDCRALERRYPIPFSRTTSKEFRVFYREWADELDKMDFEALGKAGQVDYLLLRRRIQKGLLMLDVTERRFDEALPWMPFADPVIRLEETRLAIKSSDAAEAAEAFAVAAKATKDLQKRKSEMSAVISARVVRFTARLKEALENWYTECAAYDPAINWWTSKPYQELKDALDSYTTFLKEEIMGEKKGEEPPIVSEPMGRELLKDLLANEMICYSPEELMEIAEKELVGCEKRIAVIAEQLGFPGDHKAAVEHIKKLHVQPGEQPQVARRLGDEAVAFLEKHGLVSVPELAKRVWRQQMIKPEQQKDYPFLWGGETIGTSFAHIDMLHEQKQTSMRSNNIPFLRATVHHELIPGHHLQIYCGGRLNKYRRAYGTPFYGEGWPLYWELVLYDKEFPETPEDKLGFLFWRMHRCARILVVLGFHIGKMTIQECLDLIIDRVGHETVGGTSQVRWLTGGGPEALYGAAYMLGALQLLSLRRDLVETRKTSERQFHDAVLAANSMPIELLRALLEDRPLTRDYRAQWRFYD